MGTTRAVARRIIPILLVAGAMTAVSCRTQSSVRRAEALLDAGDPLGARAVLLSEPSDRAEAWWVLGRIQGSLSDWHADRGIVALEAGDFAAARHHLEQTLEIEPGHPRALAAYAALGSRLAQRESARDLLFDSIGRSDWREAVRAASLLTPRDLAEDPRIGPLGSGGQSPHAVLRGRLWRRIDSELETAFDLNDLPAFRERLAEADTLLELPHSSGNSSDELEEGVAEWRALLGHRETAEGHRRRAWSDLADGEELSSWRHYRLALQRDPGNPANVEAERTLRASIRRVALAALESAIRDCDPRAAEAALVGFDELGEGWPDEAAVSRTEVESWIREDRTRRALEAERRGWTGAALLLWIEIAAEGGHPDALRRADRLIVRLRQAPRIVARCTGDPPARIPRGALEVVLLPIRVEETLDRHRVVQPAGWVRSGSFERPDPWHQADTRRWHATLLESLELFDAWLAARPTRAALSLRRFEFRLRELVRLRERLGRHGPTQSRGVWSSQDLVFIEETRRIRVARPLLLLRDGHRVGELAVEVEDEIRGRLPEEATPGAIDHLPPGEAQSERLRVRLEAECRRRLPWRLEEIRRSEVHELFVEALKSFDSGKTDDAIEMMVEAWVQADSSDAWRDRAADALAEWTEVPLEALIHLLP